MYIKIFKLLALVISVFILHIDCFAEVIEIKIKEFTEINSDKIILGDIAVFSNTEAELSKKLNFIVIGNAPLPGDIREISNDNINIRLKQNGIATSDIKVIFPNSCKIKRGSIKVDRKRIELATVNYIHRTVPWEKEKVILKNIRSNKDFILPNGNISFKFETSINEDFLGTTPITVYILIDDVIKQKTIVSVDIAAFEQVVFTKNPIRRYMRINEEDLYTKKMNLAELPNDSIMEIKDVVGMRAKRNIGPNALVRHAYIEIPPLVKKGDIVSIIAESDDLKITTLGIAKEKGSRGNKILVENVNSKKEIYVYIVDSRTVRVQF